MNSGEAKNNDMDAVNTFLFDAILGPVPKEQILDKVNTVTSHINELTVSLAELQLAVDKISVARKANDAQTVTGLEKEYGSEDDIQGKYADTENKRNEWVRLLSELEKLLLDNKYFNKSLCFANIRLLLRQNPNVKIGQIEKAAGNRLGYMSRLEKDGNTTDPTIEFVAAAAKLLNVSLDTLIGIDLTGLTPTEQYLINFFDKLMKDTLADKLDWNRETAFNLNRIEPDINGFIYHPLFAEETFSEETECEYPESVTRIVFNSKTFGPRTAIAGDCFNLRLKNGTILYLMDIEKSVHRVNDLTAFSRTKL